MYDIKWMLNNVCVNTIGSYECACPFITTTDEALDPTRKHDVSLTPPEEEFWELMKSTESLRTAWDLSLSYSTSHCPSMSSSSTSNCCMRDAHTASGMECRSTFRCPTDPCVSDVNANVNVNVNVNEFEETKNNKKSNRKIKDKTNLTSSSSPCASSATCARTDNPLAHPAYTCTCPKGTIGHGKKCRPGMDPTPQPKVGFDGVTPTSETMQHMKHYCGCTKPTIDPCVGSPPCPMKNQVCVPDANDPTQPSCQCKHGYVMDDKYGCIDLTPPTLQLRCDTDNTAITVLQRGDIYQECAVDIVDDNAEDYARSLKIAYSAPLSPGRCLAKLDTFTVKYTVATPWTNPPFVAAIRTVQVKDRNVCAIPKSEYSNWCPDILPKCDTESGATCQPEIGGWSCKCPRGMTGDGILVSERGTSCVDNQKPIIELLGVNPRVFKTCGCGGLTGHLSNRPNTDNNNDLDSVEVEDKWSRYETDLQSMIQATDGAELCASFSTTKKSRISAASCIRAFDDTYKGKVDLTDRVIVGKPIRVPNHKSKSNQKEFMWKIPYDVMDDAGNNAITVYRQVKVIEMSFAELELSIQQDILKGKEHDIEEAVQQALMKERELRAKEEREDWKKTQTQHRQQQQVQQQQVQPLKCPACPKCSECKPPKHSSSAVATPESCRAICQAMNQGSSETCASSSSPTDPIAIHFIPDFVKHHISALVGDGIQNMVTIIVYCVVIGIGILLFVRLLPRNDDYVKMSEEQERALFNAVTYNQSPAPVHNSNNNPMMSNHSTPIVPSSAQRSSLEGDQGAGGGMLPPPRASMSFSTPMSASGNNSIFSPHPRRSPAMNMNSASRRDADDIYYQNTDPITPTFSSGRTGGP